MPKFILISPSAFTLSIWDLRSKHQLFQVLVQGNSLTNDQLEIINKLRFRVQSVLRAKKSKYILLNAPNDKIEAISLILPVLKSPTVLPLAKIGWSSLHSVINAEDFWEVIDQLKDAGAEDILVCPIEKMVL